MTNKDCFPLIEGTLLGSFLSEVSTGLDGKFSSLGKEQLWKKRCAPARIYQENLIRVMQAPEIKLSEPAKALTGVLEAVFKGEEVLGVQVLGQESFGFETAKLALSVLEGLGNFAFHPSKLLGVKDVKQQAYKHKQALQPWW